MNMLTYFHNLPLQYRLTLLISITVLVSGSFIYTVSITQYKHTIMAQAINQLKTIRENRIRDIRVHIEQQLYNLDNLASEPLIKRALSEYKRRKLEFDSTSSNYQQAKRLLGQYLSYYRQKAGYDDMFLISPAGDIFYTLAKKSDLGTNLVHGKYRNTQLANVFHHATFFLSSQTSAISYYPPSNKAARFLITPVFGRKSILGFVAIRLNLSALANVITSITGLQRTGEVVAGILNGRNSALLVAPLRHAPDAAMHRSIKLGSTRDRPLQLALRGQSGHASSIDYRGIAVEAAWAYVPEMEIGVVVKIDSDELMEPVVSLQHSVLMVVLIILALTLYASVALSRSITRPIRKLKKIARSYAKGKYDIRSALHGHDEIGQLSAAFNSMADTIKQSHEHIKQQNRELKQYGEQLEQRVQERTATLTAANEEIKSFAYIVSHDLRSPLVNIKGFTGELNYALQEIARKIEPIRPSLKTSEQQEIQHLIEEDIPESIQFISTSVEKMDHMLSAILTLSRLGRRQLKLEPINLQTLCEGILSSLSYQIDQSQTQTKLGYLPVIENDHLVMEQIMGNLIDNAVKYLEPHRPGNIDISAVLSDSGINITVRDNGRGILPQEEMKVFQIFRRGVHQDVKGEGMGLPYVQTLVRAQGGNISFVAAPDCGTIFSVFLPFQGKKDRV